MMTFIRELLSGFHFYRKWKGGTWYRVYDPASEGGLASHISFWTQEIPEGDWEIYKQEDFG